MTFQKHLLCCTKIDTTPGELGRAVGFWTRASRASVGFEIVLLLVCVGFYPFFIILYNSSASRIQGTHLTLVLLSLPWKYQPWYSAAIPWLHCFPDSLPGSRIIVIFYSDGLMVLRSYLETFFDFVELIRCVDLIS